MTDPKKITAKKIEIFLSKLSEMVESLPTQDMKDRTNQELDTLINFLLEFQDRMKNVPTLEETSEITSTIEKLITIVKMADSDPFLSRALGLSVQKSGRTPKRKSLSEVERTTAKELAHKIKDLSPNEIEMKLEDKNTYRILVLRQVANELGIKVDSKATRESIIDKILRKISNIRGYEYLRNRESEAQ